MSKQSPAPWSYKKDEWEDGFIILDSDGESVTETGCGCCSPSGVGVWLECDARLIAAAPDLLEALKLLLENHTQLVNFGDCGNWDVEGEPAVIAARAAIARARGEA